MIARNYVKFPEAMQAQRELWSKSRRDTIMMRIAGLIMRGTTAPAWVKAAKAAAHKLANAIKTLCRNWTQEHAKADQKPTKGFAAHCRKWNDSRAEQLIVKARETIQAATPDHT